MSTNLKLTNQLAHLPNDVRITKYESHQTYFERKRQIIESITNVKLLL